MNAASEKAGGAATLTRPAPLPELSDSYEAN